MLNGFAGREISEEEGSNRLASSSTFCFMLRVRFALKDVCVLVLTLP